MSTYETYLLTAMALLIVSLLSGFNAVTNRRSVALALVLFVFGGFALYQATTLSNGGNLAEDIPDAIYKLYAKIVN
jgi:hypothetical protein